MNILKEKKVANLFTKYLNKARLYVKLSIWNLFASLAKLGNSTEIIHIIINEDCMSAFN